MAGLGLGLTLALTLTLTSAAFVCAVVSAPGVPRYAVRTVRPWLVRVPSTYSTRGPGVKPPCASGTYPTREAGTRSLYVPDGGPGAYASAPLRAGLLRALALLAVEVPG